MLSLNINTQYAVNLSQQSDVTDSIMEKLSSGLNINSAGDDPAGITIAESMRAEVNGSQQAQSNIQSAMNILQTGEDGVQSLLPVLDRMKTLALQAANGTAAQSDKDAMQTEMDQLRQLFAQAYTTAKDYRVNLDGVNNSDRQLTFQVGPNANDTVNVDYNPLRDVLGPFTLSMFGYADLYNSQYQDILAGQVGSPIPKPDDPVPPPPAGPVTPPGTTWAQLFPKQDTVNGTAAQTNSLMTAIDNAKTGLTGQLSYLGAVQDRLQSTMDSVSAVQLDLADSESKIRDTDVAAQMTALTRSQVIQQSAQAMLSQANQRPLQVLQLLKSN